MSGEELESQRPFLLEEGFGEEEIDGLISGKEQTQERELGNKRTIAQIQAQARVNNQATPDIPPANDRTRMATQKLKSAESALQKLQTEYAGIGGQNKLGQQALEPQIAALKKKVEDAQGAVQFEDLITRRVNEIVAENKGATNLQMRAILKEEFAGNPAAYAAAIDNLGNLGPGRLQ